MEERTGIIYQAKCLVTGKSYIGQTVQSLTKRMQRHLRDATNGSEVYFCRALRKHGEESFRWTTIAIVPESRLENLEKAFIKTMNTFGSGGYNMTEGGETNFGASNPFYGKTHTDETKKSISEANKGNKFSVGRILKESTKRKIGAGTSKLTSENIVEIRKLYTEGLTHQEISEKYSVGRHCIGRILRKETWTHVPD